MAIPKIGRAVYEQRKYEQRKEDVSVAPDRQAEDVRLNEAVEVLLEYLPTDTVMLMREASEQMNLPLWQLILGYVVRCWDGHLMFSPHILAAWETRGKPNKPRPCQSCGLLFISQYPDAAFCCPECHFGKLEELDHRHDCPTRFFPQPKPEGDHSRSEW